MEHYPVYLKLQNKKVLVVGGGSVAFRKVKGLVNTGAQISVVSPDFIKAFEELADKPFVNLKKREFEEKDIDKADFLFSATDNQQLNQKISDIAGSRNIMCNIADSPESSDFIIPSRIKRGDLDLTVSTGGKSPALSKKLRLDLEKIFGSEYEIFLYILGEIRQAVLKKKRGNPENKEIFKRLVFGETLNMIKKNDIDGLNKELTQIIEDKKIIDDIMVKIHNMDF